MKKFILSTLVGITMMGLTSGCSVGSGPTNKVYPPTIGQQLIDLKKALDAGALTEQEYAAEKTKILNAQP
jgi:hypothetical protein